MSLLPLLLCIFLAFGHPAFIDEDNDSEENLKPGEPTGLNTKIRDELSSLRHLPSYNKPASPSLVNSKSTTTAAPASHASGTPSYRNASRYLTLWTTRRCCSSSTTPASTTAGVPLLTTPTTSAPNSDYTSEEHPHLSDVKMDAGSLPFDLPGTGIFFTYLIYMMFSLLSFGLCTNDSFRDLKV
jgi:hypothetical protein